MSNELFNTLIVAGLKVMLINLSHNCIIIYLSMLFIFNFFKEALDFTCCFLYNSTFIFKDNSISYIV